MEKSETAKVKSGRTIVLASGGTGGHLFPAQALAAELESRGWSVQLFTDKRGLEWRDRFRDGTVHEIASSTLTFGKPWQLPAQASQLVLGFRQCLARFKQLTPQGGGWLRRVSVAAGHDGCALCRHCVHAA